MLEREELGRRGSGAGAGDEEAVVCRVCARCSRRESESERAVETKVGRAGPGRAGFNLAIL